MSGNNVKFVTAERSFVGACMMTVTVKTTGFCGGDSGHGGRSEIVLSDDGGFNLDGSDQGSGRIVIRCGGDAELMMLSDVLVCAGNVLKGLAEVKEKL
jgi:hypothetical protein